MGNFNGGNNMKKNPTGVQKTAIVFLTGLVMVSFLLIIPISADAGEMVVWEQNSNGLGAAQPGTDYTQVSAGVSNNLAIEGDENGPIDPPDFPAIVVPVMLILGLAGAILLALREQ
jgi:hypothetical protein